MPTPPDPDRTLYPHAYRVLWDLVLGGESTARDLARRWPVGQTDASRLASTLTSLRRDGLVQSRPLGDGSRTLAWDATDAGRARVTLPGRRGGE